MGRLGLSELLQLCGFRGELGSGLFFDFQLVDFTLQGFQHAGRLVGHQQLFSVANFSQLIFQLGSGEFVDLTLQRGDLGFDAGRRIRSGCVDRGRGRRCRALGPRGIWYGDRCRLGWNWLFIGRELGLRWLSWGDLCGGGGIRLGGVIQGWLFHEILRFGDRSLRRVTEQSADLAVMSDLNRNRCGFRGARSLSCQRFGGRFLDQGRDFP